MTLKKTAVAVLAFASSTAFAGSMGPVCMAGNVTVPCEPAAWSFGVQALYLQPTFGDDMRFIGLNRTTTTTTHIANAPDWAWGFKLEGAYRFGSGNDLNLNWSHLGSKTTSFNSDRGFFVPLEGTNLLAVKPNWDAVNLEYGQHVAFGDFKNIRLHGGIQYARIKTSMPMSGTWFTGDPDAPTSTYTANPKATFNGIGPRIGVDMSYGWGNGFGIYGNAAAAILAGKSKFNNLFIDTTRGTEYSSMSKTIVVPDVEAKVGLNYTYTLSQGWLTLDAGYMWVNYFDAQQTFYGTDPDNNFSLQGPYVGLKWVGGAV